MRAPGPVKLPTFPRLRDVIAGVIATSMPTLVLHGCPTPYDKAYVVEMPTGSTNCELACATLASQPRGHEYVSSIDECILGEAVSSVPDAGPRTVAICRATVMSNSGAGRRPAGLARAHTVRAASEEGAFFARIAHLEAASVTAFERLAGELATHDAPCSLVRRAIRATADERRHARITDAWRERFGGRAIPVRIAPARNRSLAAMARDNAVEGCVHETWGAVIATVQARSAHPALRDDLARIARDETRHAELSWAIDAWSAPRLRARDRVAVRAARDAAVARLERELSHGDHESAPARARLGLPAREECLALFSATRTALWS